MASDLTAAMAKVVEVLTPLGSEDRLRVVDASLTLLGDGAATRQAPHQGQQPRAPQPPGGTQRLSLSEQGRLWASRNDVSDDDLERWYYFDGGVAKLLAFPKNVSKRSQQAIDTYLLHGLGVFLSSGEDTFSDRDARALCEHLGCYDRTNHAKVYKAFGNKITGSKSAGWKLTAPGRAAAGALVKGGQSA